MKTYGNIKELKESLVDVFTEKTQELDRYFDEKAKEMKGIYDEKLKQMKTEHEQRLSEEVETLRERLENNRRVEMNKAVQKKKEDMIMKIIDEMRKDAKNIAHSKKYKDYVKKNVPKKSTIYADSTDYDLGSDIKVDKNITGVKAVSANIIYDFTIGSLIDANIEKLKELIAKELFK